ncbi:hypothetical protein GCM10017750_68040 [Streptomyces racemochromogenes]
MPVPLNGEDRGSEYAFGKKKRTTRRRPGSLARTERTVSFRGLMVSTGAGRKCVDSVRGGVIPPVVRHCSLKGLRGMEAIPVRGALRLGTKGAWCARDAISAPLTPGNIPRPPAPGKEFDSAGVPPCPGM